jgi:hypothetical protein
VKGGKDMKADITILIVAVVGIVAITGFAVFAIKLIIATVRNSKSDDKE